MTNLRTDPGVESVRRACAILKAFEDENEFLRVQDIASRTGLHKATVSRLLLTLESSGLVERIARRGFRAQVRLLRRHHLKIGYASQSENSLFAHEVTASLQRAAEAEKISLIVTDNCHDPAITLKNVDRMIAERVDVAIEFQTIHDVAQVISSKFQQARIPLISVDMPYPGATYYGGDNYEAGLIAGKALGRWTRQHWPDGLYEILLIGLPAAGSLPELRLTAGLAGLQQIVPGAADLPVTRLDGGNSLESTRAVVQRHLRTASSARCAILAINDPGALGAIRAFESQGLREQCVAVGQGATLDARLEMRQPESRLIGSVAFFPEKYGPALVKLALDVAQRRVVPPAVYTRHRLITSNNADILYPNDLAALNG